MNKHIAPKLMSLLSRRELKERLAKVAMMLSCLAVFCVTYVLVAPVLTEEWPAVCGVEEHMHDDSCYTERLVEPVPELTCGMEETGHTHTDGCYEIHQGDLMCTETGTEETPHTHDDSCYAWNYELVCTESEEGHIHDESCYAEPAEPYTELVLTCELPEHTHTDICYHVPDESPVTEYTCGLVEHMHAEDCYFESGELKCTVPEHAHTNDCLAEEILELGENEELMLINEQFAYENDEVSITFAIQGEVPVSLPEVMSESAEDLNAESELAETEVSTAPVLELTVTESEDMDVYREYEELAGETGDVILVQVLDYCLTLGGEPVDLNWCEVTVEVTPKQALQELMESPMAPMTYAVEDMEIESEETEMVMELSAYSETPGEMAYALVVGANPSFRVQYYAWLERAVMDTDEIKLDDSQDEVNLSVARKLPIINTDNGSDANNSNKQGKLPTNGTGRYGSPNNNSVATLNLKEDGSIETQNILTEIYKSEELTYQKAPGLMYFNIVNSNAKSQYILKQIWVLEDETRMGNTEETGWRVINYRSDLRFTNRPETAAANPDDYILITENTVIRLVYDTKKTEEDMPVNFYDYDISDGFIYTANNLSNQTATSKQNDGTWYANTTRSGINSNINYTNTGSDNGKLAFGNANAGTDFGEVKWGDQYLNKINANSFMIATYGLAQSLDADGNIVYSAGVNAPKLFNEGPATGKTSYDKDEYSLKFDRAGDTYTLTAVNGTSATNLDKFTSLRAEGTWIKPLGYKYIHTNNFWPMDSVPSWGADGHDLKFGNKSMTAKRNSLKGNLPTSDDEKDHNPYFGMQYAVTFDLSASYVGPLEYFFFGDDDMWVFLDGRLVCDIGGVHTSVGEYVNLWDYIDRKELLNEDGSPIKVQKLDNDGNPIPLLDKNGQQIVENGEPQWEMTDKVKTYTLTFYYTERGSSGSTCWMQFTLPTVVGVNLDSVLDEQISENTGSISIEKRLDGIENNEWFEFNLKLESPVGNDNYTIDYLLRDANGDLIPNDQIQNDKDYIADGEHFRIRAGDVLVIRGLPVDTKYTVEELTTAGYHTQITTDGGDPISGTVASGTIVENTRIKVVYTNYATYELPATGGSGTVIWYTMGGLLVLAGLGFLVYNNKQQRGKSTI